MPLSLTRSALSASLDEPTLVGSAGLAPVIKLAAEAGLHSLAGRQLTVPTNKVANAGSKSAVLVASRCADADSFHNMAILRRGR
ncbi:hypothetical protein IEE92_04300 [Kocuria sp. cx-116]|uniref:hypothetical protein n=1 Tax=Kocuria sp. cx-116 TaxID=2771378 RepID=UPI0016865F50|nr:hypothetical protein [Kocuria sp. cx-116]MBD2761781.1 hypothetical protein [Kocuria sp. cx-116]